MLSNVRITRKDDSSLFSIPFLIRGLPMLGALKGDKGFYLHYVVVTERELVQM